MLNMDHETAPTDPALDPSLIPDNETLLMQGRGLATSGVPLQVGGLYEALAQLRARATGSTAASFPGLMTQLGGLRQTYADASSALARRLGYGGGGQVERGRSALLANAGRQYAGLLGGAQQSGFTGLLNVLGKVQPQLSGAARPPNISNRTSSNDAAQFASAQLGGQALPGQLRTLWNAWGPSGPVSSEAQAAGAIQGFRQDPRFTTGINLDEY